jgi:16S rRNA (guanine966-N2)-methyltransferase
VTRQSGKKNKSASGRLRIVAGNWRSRVLEIADVPGLRPTAERIRETLFNWLAPQIAGARCLDLFAGTGALGLEALSRGAGSTVFVESSPQAVAALRRNISSLDASLADVQAVDAMSYLQQCDALFDVVFLDPPFAEGNLEELCRLIAGHGILANAANVYLEQDRAAPEPQLPAGWTLLKSKTAGNVRYMLAGTGGQDQANQAGEENGE